MNKWLLPALMVPHLCLAQGLLLGAGTPPPAPPACMTVTADGVASTACPNDQQKALVAQHQANMDANAPSNRSAPTRLGLYNQAAVRQQFGNTFGKSTVPQQLPPPNYANPLTPHP